MSGIDSVTNPPAAPDEPVTEKIAVSSSTALPVTAAVPAVAQSGGGGSFPFDTTSESEEWPNHGPARGIRLSWPIAALLVLLIAGGGIWGGAALQRNQKTGTGSLASAFASRIASARTGGSRLGGGGTGGTGGFGGLSSSAAATGTVTEVTGSTLYVTNASGSLVEVKLSPSTTVTRNAKSVLSALQPGDTVVVQGTKQKNGMVTAASVTATAQGVSSGFGGFGAG
jgi:hypothetical protein